MFVEPLPQHIHYRLQDVAYHDTAFGGRHAVVSIVVRLVDVRPKPL